MNCRRKKLRLEERKRRNSMVLLTLKREGQEEFFVVYVCYSNHGCKVSNRVQELGCVPMLVPNKVFAGRGLTNFFFVLFSTKMIISINIIKIVALTQ